MPYGTIIGGTGYQSEIALKPTRLRSLSYSAVHHAIHPCSKLQGIQAKANKILANNRYFSYFKLFYFFILPLDILPKP